MARTRDLAGTIDNTRSGFVVATRCKNRHHSLPAHAIKLSIQRFVFPQRPLYGLSAQRQ